jgi:hypothetical protein
MPKELWAQLDSLEADLKAAKEKEEHCCCGCGCKK